MRALILAALLALGACATNAERNLLVACQGYASALTSLAAFKSKLSVEEVGAVDVIRLSVNPICRDTAAVESPTDALNTVQDAAFRLLQMKEAHE